MADSFPHSICVRLLRPFSLPQFGPQVFLIADSGFLQLLRHFVLEALVNVSGAVLLVQVPHVLLDQRLLMSSDHHAAERQVADGISCRSGSGALTSSAGARLPVDPVEGDAAQERRSRLWVLRVETRQRAS